MLLDEFEIIRVLGAGGFGIVYLALDTALLRYVAIKEFMPTALVSRVAGDQVKVHTDSAAKTFELGLDSFFNEGRMLARFDHPSLVKVFRFWRANGTAYMAMQYYPGQTLKDVRQAMSGPPSEAWLRGLVDPMLDALAVLHEEGIYHRDIAPDNILMLPDGRPVILDFGSARRVLGDKTQSLTAILKPNFSPVEQYADEGAMRQAGYTDLYALGGTVYFMLTGRAPIPSAMRAVRDALPLLANEGAARCPQVSTAFLEAIDWALAVDPDFRPQTVAALRSALDGDHRPPPPSSRHGVRSNDPADEFASDAMLATTQVHAPTGKIPFERTMRAPRPDHIARAAAATPPRRPGRLGLAAAVGTVVLTGAVWAAVATGRGQEPSPAQTPPSQAVHAPPVEPAARPAAIVPVAAAPVAPLVADVAPEAKAVRARGPAERRQPAVAPQPQSRPETKTLQPGPIATEQRIPAPEPCSGMNFIARAACLSRACDAPDKASLPQCSEVRRIAEQRQRRMDQ